MTPEQYIQKLTEITSNKLDSLKKILALTVQQSQVITENSADKLQEIIDLKQKHMNLIDEMDDAFEVYYSRLKSVMGVKSLEEISITQLQGAGGLKEMVSIVYETIKKIQIIEDQNNKDAKIVLSNIAKEIRQVKQGKMANNGYNIGGKLPQQSFFFDTKK
jgi:hypothetical protein